MMRIVFLGTSSMMPTANRNHPSVLIVSNGDYLMFDCGEGTQRQMAKAKLSTAKVGYIFITHWHGDHCLGIPGMLQSMNSNQKQDKIMIFGPEGTRKRVKAIMGGFSWKNNLEIEVKEVNKGKAHETDKWVVQCTPVEHTIEALAYSFKEKDTVKINTEYTKKFGLTEHPLLGKLQKGQAITWKNKVITPEKGTFKKIGKKATYIVDTAYMKSLANFAKDSDALICEAMFTESEEGMSKEKKHLTSKQAANIAKMSKSKRLLLTHISQRNSKKSILEEAKSVFGETAIAEDLMEIQV